MGLFSSTKARKIPEEEVPPPTPEQVQYLLNTALPNRGRDSYFVSAGTAGIESTHAMAKVHGDGVWVCCCGHNTTLVHREGTYPFKRLVCEKCDHILCEHCLTTAIVIPLKEPFPATVAKLEFTKLREIVDNLFQICPDCGLSFRSQIRNPDHRGERFCWVPVASHSHSELCPCGASAKSNWLKCIIGDSTAYLLDPAKALDGLKDIRVERELEEEIRLGYRGLKMIPPDSRWESLGYHRAQVSETPLVRSGSGDLSAQNISKPSPANQPLRRRPERLVPIQHSSLKRSGAVRGKNTSRFDPTAGARAGSYSETPTNARPRIISRAETWATPAEHQRAHERFSFNDSEDISLYHRGDVSPSRTAHDGSARPRILPRAETWATAAEHERIHGRSSFNPSEGDPRTPTGNTRTPNRTMHAPPQRPLFSGNTRQQSLGRSDTIMSSHGTIEYASDTYVSDDERTPQQSRFPARTAPNSVLDGRKSLEARQSMAEENVKGYMSGTPAAAFFEPPVHEWVDRLDLKSFRIDG